MTTITVWLLVIASEVRGVLIAVQPQMYPTLANCEQVARNLPWQSHLSARCIQTTVVKP